MAIVRDFCACEVQEGREQIQEGDRRGVAVSSGGSRRGWSADDEGHARGSFFEAGFGDEAVFTHAFSVVRGEYDDGVFPVAAFFQGGYDFSYAVVEMGDFAHVLGGHFGDGLATVFAAFFVVVFWEDDIGGVVHFGVFAGCVQRWMRSGKAGEEE